MAHYRLKAYRISAIAVPALVSLASVAFIAGCKKDKAAPAVVEETPMETAPQNTDTSAVMQEEPALSQVGGKTHGKAKENHAPAPAGIVQDGRFVVQVSVFKSARKAGHLVEQLAGQGYPAYVAEVQDPTPELSGTWHRVRVGTFRSLADARSFGDNTLRPMGYDFWVDKKTMDNVGQREGGGSSDASYSSETKPARESSPASRPEPSSTSITPSVAEPPAPSSAEPAVPAPSAGWGNTPEPAAPESNPGWGTPSNEPPAPSSSSGWGNTPEAGTTPPPAVETPPAATPAPVDTGAPKLDDW